MLLLLLLFAFFSVEVLGPVGYGLSLNRVRGKRSQELEQIELAATAAGMKGEEGEGPMQSEGHN